MKRTFILGLIGLMGLMGEVRGQKITYDTDTTCGCDIYYIDGIQTTREGNLYGFKRSDGGVIVPNIFRYVDQFGDAGRLACMLGMGGVSPLLQ